MRNAIHRNLFFLWLSLTLALAVTVTVSHAKHGGISSHKFNKADVEKNRPVNESAIIRSSRAFVSFQPAPPQGPTFIVTNTNDSGAGSLRQAIGDSNNLLLLDTSTISFNIPGSGVQTIAPLAPLPNITHAVIIDGYTQPGASANTLDSGDNANLLIELNGANVGGIGLHITNGNSTVKGLVINRFFIGGSAGIQIDTHG